MEDRGPRLVLVGTPIGNLGDMAPRAVEALAGADLIACEDTRRTGRLLEHLGVRSPGLVRFDDHTEPDVAPRLIERVRDGAVVAVVSDAGLPGLSDPGARLVRLAAEADVLVEAVPGPFAGAVALLTSGLLDVSGRFCFEGFLPRKGSERSARLGQLVGERRTIVLYEAPHRLGRTLEDLAATLGADRSVAIGRELTKRHEEIWRGTLGAALERAAAVEPRGEHVLVVAGDDPPEPLDDDAVLAALARQVAAGASRRDAAAAVAAELGLAPNRVKRLATSLTDQGSP